MVQRRGGNKFTGEKQEQINNYSQNQKMATSNKTDPDQEKFQ